MALIKCKECGTEVSSKAENCPKCGAKVAKKMGCGTLIGVVFLGLVIIIAISTPGTGNNSSSQTKNSAVTADIQNISAPLPKIPGSQWNYHQHNDEMGKGTIYQARVLSINTVNFDFPYSGAQHGALTLRTHPRHGKRHYFQY